MSRYALARQGRRALDARLAGVDTSALAPPRAGGWVKLVRLALGMTATDVAVRMGVSRQAVHALEASEHAGTARMSTLAAAAEAMGCQLVYAIIPLNGGTFEGIVQAQAGRVVDAELGAVTKTMTLEDQAVEPLLPSDRQDAIADLLRSPGRLLWRS